MTNSPETKSSGETKPLLEVRGLSKFFLIKKGLLRKVVGQVRAVDDVSFHIMPGETLGLVGESGCGKTTTGRLVLRLLGRSAGEMIYRDNGREVNLATLDGSELRNFRKNMQLILQDPFSSLNPRMTVLDIISEPLKAHKVGGRKEIEARVKELTGQMGLRIEYLRRYPHAFSGGQRQRIGIARALTLNPRLIVCDEPVSALDVSVQAQIINLLKDLQERLGLAYLFIAHDLSVVENISHRVAVMYAGRLVEMAPTRALFDRPLHPYTQALLSAAPKPHPKAKKERILLPGDVADPANLPTGCAFHPRCRYCREGCSSERPPLRDLGDGRQVACHYAGELF